MPLRTTFYLPLTNSGSSTTPFMRTMRHRDRFLGKPACVVCGEAEECGLGVTAIIPWTKEGARTWKGLQNRGVISDHSKLRLNPQNALVLCALHSTLFVAHLFYIHVDPSTHKSIFVNLTENPSQARFHGKAIGLSNGDQAGPYPALLQYHETQARELHGSISTVPSIPREIVWQAWLLEGAVDRESGLFERDRPPSHAIPKVSPRSSESKVDEHTVDLKLRCMPRNQPRAQAPSRLTTCPTSSST